VIGAALDTLAERVEIESRTAAIPQLQDGEAAHEISIERTARKLTQVVQIADLGALACGTHLFGDYFFERKAGDIGGCEWQQLEVVLLDLCLSEDWHDGRLA